ncbi:MAG: OpgC domain-containing protein, partial [Methylococcaceae bacterium]
NDPAPVFWPWKSMLSIIDAKFFQDMYMAFFLKSLLGLGRVFNNMALFVIAYYLLTNYWSPINKTLGWLFVPLGQASLYVFFVHVYFVLLASNTPLNEYNNFYLNTVVHVTTILIIWAMVKQKFLFQIIPR